MERERKDSRSRTHIDEKLYVKTYTVSSGLRVVKVVNKKVHGIKSFTIVLGESKVSVFDLVGETEKGKKLRGERN